MWHVACNKHIITSSLSSPLLQAMRLMDLYSSRGIGPDRVYIKLASTWEGVEACRKLQRQGVDCNMTLLFSFGQVRHMAKPLPARRGNVQAPARLS
jgi:transaldolase